ncbi:MAG: type IV toxin-antitoxin system AbiEi family antitoxin [Xenococcaceae cyanobacterium]
MTPNEELLEECLAHLNNLPEIHANPANHQSSSFTDGHIIVKSPFHSTDYHYNIKLTVTNANVDVAIDRLKRFQTKSNIHPLLLTRHVPENALDRLLKQNLEFIDAAGNMFLSSPATYILIRGKRYLKHPAAKTKTITTTGLKLIYILLQNPYLLQATYREMAASAGVAVGSVANILNNLEKFLYIQRQRSGGYRLTDYTKLLHRWELGYAERLRPKLFLGTFTPSRQSFSELRENIIKEANNNRFLIGGELGAAIATDYLRPQKVTLHVSGNHRPLLVKLRLKPDPNGEITLLNQFGTSNAWVQEDETAEGLTLEVSSRVKTPRPGQGAARVVRAENQNPPLASPLLLYAELLMENDERLRSTAERLKDQYIAPQYLHA